MFQRSTAYALCVRVEGKGDQIILQGSAKLIRREYEKRGRSAAGYCVYFAPGHAVGEFLNAPAAAGAGQ